MLIKRISMTAALLAGVLMALAGCGNKGALTLPSRPATAQPKPAVSQTPSEEKTVKAMDHNSAPAPANDQ